MHTGFVRSEKWSHKNAIKHEKGKKGHTPRFSDNTKYPPKKTLVKTPKTLPWISNDCASMIVKILFFYYGGKTNFLCLHLTFEFYVSMEVSTVQTNQDRDQDKVDLSYQQLRKYC